MNSHARRRGPQAGFSLVELLLVLGIMITLSAAVFSLMASSVKTSTTAYEMSQAQQSVRTAQEYINRDLVVAGDGFRAISNIPVRVNFATDYLAGDPVTDPDNSNIALLGLITSDDEAAEGTPVLGSDPAVEVRPGTDRITILSVDETFPFVSPSSITISTTGDIFRIKASEALRMSVGAIYCLTSSEGATFGTLTAITGSGSTRNAIFGPTDAYGLNQPGTGTINAITRSGAQPTTLKRVQMIHYFVNEDGLLIRRVFGVAGGQGYTDGVIAEHLSDLQFRYALNLRDANGNIQQPVPRLTQAQLDKVRQVEVTVTAETAHNVLHGGEQSTNDNTQNDDTVSSDGKRARVTMTSSTSIRNMQFREALQPTSGS